MRMLSVIAAACAAVATASLGFAQPQAPAVRSRLALVRKFSYFGISMQDGANIITLGEDLKRAMQAITSELPVGIEVTQIADQPHIVEESISEFVETFVEALGIVLLVSFVSLG